MIAQLRDLIDQIATLTVPDQLCSVVASPPDSANNRLSEIGPVPYWASPCNDFRHLLGWDSHQYVAQVRLGRSMVLGLIDTGACRTIIDTRTADACGLEVVRAIDGNCGSYATPGCGATNYYGVVKGPVKFRFSPEVEVELPWIRVIDHPHCLLLFGADILRYGQTMGDWGFVGIVNKKLAERVHSYLIFEKEGHQTAVCLASCPAANRVPFRVEGAKYTPPNY